MGCSTPVGQIPDLYLPFTISLSHAGKEGPKDTTNRPSKGPSKRLSLHPKLTLWLLSLPTEKNQILVGSGYLAEGNHSGR